jgi:hypothetical protein
MPLAEILGRIAQVDTAVDNGDLATARSMADGAVRDAVLTLAEPYRGNMLQILDDLVAVL